MDTKKYNVTTKAIKSVANIELDIKLKKGAKVLSFQKPASIDLEAIVLTNKNHRLYDGIVKNFDKIKKVPSRLVLSKDMTDASCVFEGGKTLEEIDVSNFQTSKITNMESMFQMCKNVKVLDLSSFDTSHVQNFRSFCSPYPYKESALEKVIGVIDMSSVPNGKGQDVYEGMFLHCKNLNGLKIKNPPADFMTYNTYRTGSVWKKYGYELAGLTRDQFEIVD